LLHDRPDLVTSDSRATVVLNIGAENTDLVVCTKSAVWQRCILIGGNAFTKAIADTFRLNYEKAEKLKRTAPVSKYARQIFQAMRPVFTDLASEVQRSLGFYNSSNPNTKVVKILALGGATKLRGLLKYLQQTLQIPVERPDSFKRLGMGPGVSPAKFHENVCDFGIVYGLALQGLGLARIESNLLPRNVARSMAWASKGRYFITAACILLAVSLLCFARTGLDRMNYTKNGQVRDKISAVLRSVGAATEKFEIEKGKGSEYKATIEKQFEPFKYREIIPLLHETIISALPNEKNNPGQAGLYRAFADGDVEGVLQIPRRNRKQVFITNMSSYFTYDLATAQFGGADLWRKSRGTPRGEEFEDGMGEYEYELMAMRGMEYEYSPMAYGVGAQAQEKKMPGFVVTVACYSPYGESIIELGELIDPHGVEDRRDKWGFVTRLAHLDDIEDVNGPFELYEKEDPNHFNLEIKQVNWDEEMPAGIGVQEIRYKTTATRPDPTDKGQWFLIDPMTKEIINTVPELDENGKQRIYQGKPVVKVNDHWFVLNFKFIWRHAPEPPEQAAPTSRRGMPMRPGAGRAAPPPSSGSTGGRAVPSIGDF
jgi:type IV pilus assembly protein PilM